jgi:hypothetical protein
MKQKTPQSHQKTVWEQEKDEIEKRTAFRLVLDEFWRSFDPQNHPKSHQKAIQKLHQKQDEF